MNKLESIVRNNIRSLKPYSSARDEFKGKADAFLDANENPFGELNRYPDPLQLRLKNLLAQDKGVQPEQLFIGNGSDEVIDLLFRVFCIPGKDNVITISPSYGMYQVSADINDVRLKKVQLDENFEIDPNRLLAEVNENSKIIFLCSPNNPTGNTIDLKIIEQICSEFDGIVLVDEAYIDFADTPSSSQLIDNNWNLVVSQTFSKARGLAAARVGYAIAQTQIIDLLNKVKPPYNVSALNQEAAIKALQNKEEYLQQVSYLKAERIKLQEGLKKLDIVLQIYPSEANFLLVRFSNGLELYQHLVNLGIITRNRNTQVQDSIRISVGTSEENKKLISALNNYK